MRKMIFILILLLSASNYQVLAAEVLTNEDIVDLLASGIKPQLVMQKIKSSDNLFDVSAKAMVTLRHQKVSDEIISLMLVEAERSEAGKRTKINIYIQSLASSRQKNRQAAFINLLRLGNSAQERMFNVLLETRVPAIRAALCQAMAKMEIKKSIVYLNVFLDDTDAKVRLAAAEALYTLNRKNIIEVSQKKLENWLAGDDAPAINGYLHIISMLKDKRFYSNLLRVLQESSRASDREEAANALAGLSSKDAHTALEQVLISDDNPAVRAAAARALVALAEPTSVKALAAALRSDQDNRNLIINSLSRLHSVDVLPILITAFSLEDINADNTKAVANALRRLTHQNFGTDMGQWLAWWEDNENKLSKAGKK